MKKPSETQIARTRAFWIANKPGETAAPAYVPDPPVWWHVALALMLALTVQSTLAPFYAIGGAAVSLVALLVAWYAVRTGVARGLAFGLFAGACEDALGGGSGIAWTFASGAAGALAGRLARSWLADTKLILVPAAALVTFARFGAFMLAMQIQGRPLSLPLLHLQVALWQSVQGAIVAFLVLHFVPSIAGAGAYRR